MAQHVRNTATHRRCAAGASLEQDSLNASRGIPAVVTHNDILEVAITATQKNAISFTLIPGSSGGLVVPRFIIAVRRIGNANIAPRVIFRGAKPIRKSSGVQIRTV